MGNSSCPKIFHQKIIKRSSKGHQKVIKKSSKFSIERNHTIQTPSQTYHGTATLRPSKPIPNLQILHQKPFPVPRFFITARSPPVDSTRQTPQIPIAFNETFAKCIILPFWNGLFSNDVLAVIGALRESTCFFVFFAPGLGILCVAPSAAAP